MSAAPSGYGNIPAAAPHARAIGSPTPAKCNRWPGLRAAGRLPGRPASRWSPALILRVGGTEKPQARNGLPSRQRREPHRPLRTARVSQTAQVTSTRAVMCDCLHPGIRQTAAPGLLPWTWRLPPLPDCARPGGQGWGTQPHISHLQIRRLAGWGSMGGHSRGLPGPCPSPCPSR